MVSLINVLCFSCRTLIMDEAGVSDVLANNVFNALAALSASDHIDNEWVTSVWENNFVEFDALEDGVSPEILQDEGYVLMLTDGELAFGD